MNALINSVIDLNSMHSQDKEIVEVLDLQFDQIDATTLGDNMHVTEFVEKNLNVTEESVLTTQIIKEMRMRKRTTNDPIVCQNHVVSAVSRGGVVIACLLMASKSDHSGEYDPFFMQRIKTAFDCIFADEQGEQLLRQIRDEKVQSSADQQIYEPVRRSVVRTSQIE